MEPSASKTGINILLILAIVLISASIVRTYIKKETTKPVVTAPTIEIKKPVITESVATTTVPIATTTETVKPVVTINIPGFTDKKWTWVNVSTKGKVTVPKKAGDFTILFNATGTASGTTDCNSFFSNYKAGTSTLSFGMFGSTKMFCEGSQENEFIAYLQAAKTYTLSKTNILTITDGTSTMTFK
jgi:heat shock protein HslJ